MSTLLSDKSIIGNLSKARVVARTKGWADLDLSLATTQPRKDIISLRDDRAVKNAVKNLLLTNFFERPFNSDIGANLRGLLFEPNDAITRIALRDNIQRTIRRHEPRVKLNSIEIDDQSEINAYRVTVHFLIKEYDANQQVEIILRRLR